MASRQFAVFDVDFTLHDSALGVDLLLALSRVGLTTRPLEAEYREWRASPDRGEYFKDHFVEIYHSGLLRVSKQQMDAIGEQLANNVERGLYGALRDEIARYREEGRFLCAITQSPLVVMRPLAKRLGFDAYIAADFHFDEADFYLGPQHRSDEEKDKGFSLQSLVAEHNLDWSDSAAYGDTLHDLPMLELVERPVVVNPSDNLRAVAIERSWKIIEASQ